MGKRYYPTKLNEADFMELKTMGKSRDILLGILLEVMAIEERLIDTKKS